ncbi:MAG: hypothetical protein IT422_18345 [Pirellulaceae bacterium]|jgi:hypothetical protein|nr:hypothetical protein [Pirellulaceae bacterium]
MIDIDMVAIEQNRVNRRPTSTRFVFAIAMLVSSHSLGSTTLAQEDTTETTSLYKSISEFGVQPGGEAIANRDRLQAAIDWAAPRGAALSVPPSSEPYRVAGGLVLRRNVSLIGVHGPVGRGTRHPAKPQPVGSVFAIEDETQPFITVEGATQLSGLQFWYPRQTLTEPHKIIEYPPTIRVSDSSPAQGVTLSRLTFFGEFVAMDFRAKPNMSCEQVLIEHCYGYPLSGEFIAIDYCYDIPRILHCHINPASRRFIDGGYGKAVIDSVVARETFAFWIDHTDNAQVIDAFTFGTFGGIRLGAASYGQLTNFNFDCVTVGIHKLGDSTFNRNWQISQGSIIANTGEAIEGVHPLIIEGKGHTSLVNVEAFSGPNAALTTLNQSEDFLLIRGQDKLTVSLFGCRMRNYRTEQPISIDNPAASVQAMGCIDKHDQPFNLSK